MSHFLKTDPVIIGQKIYARSQSIYLLLKCFFLYSVKPVCMMEKQNMTYLIEIFYVNFKVHLLSFAQLGCLIHNDLS